MFKKRITAVTAALAIGVASAVTVPLASADPVGATPGTCDISLTSTSINPTSAGGQNAQSVSQLVTIGVQNHTSSNRSNFRPFVKVFNLNRWMTNSTIDFTHDGPAGTYTVSADTNIPRKQFTLPIDSTFPVENVDTSTGNFTANLGDFNAATPGWGGSAAVWYSDGPNGSLVDGVTATGTLNFHTTVLPYAGENDNCQTMGIDPAGTKNIAADGKSYDSGVDVTKGAADDYSRMEGFVFLPGSETPIEGATATVDSQGNVRITLPADLDVNIKEVQVQMYAKPREGLPADASAKYREDNKVGELFTVPIGEVEPETPVTPGGSSDGKCVATVAGIGLPLLLLIPLAMGDQLNIPGLSQFTHQAQKAVQDANTQLQRGLGIENPEIMRLVDQINQQIGPDGRRIAGGVGAAALILLVLGLVSDACGSRSSLSSSESEV
ncbi:hypothetical protein CATRI_00965 [Corynebacterium atrinae]|uniref:hypothetical protein n=1 Tax=Corynebacterium atrinae TaxID=1336740 RepID=UPI0025B3E9D7|nr:hypothetical protein [Corynebacterium atrinae]WJY62310.1 hypothetical protein CATRI_00965 [Corynebacterium atrinae]